MQHREDLPTTTKRRHFLMDDDVGNESSIDIDEIDQPDLLGKVQRMCANYKQQMSFKCEAFEEEVKRFVFSPGNVDREALADYNRMVFNFAIEYSDYLAECEANIEHAQHDATAALMQAHADELQRLRDEINGMVDDTLNIPTISFREENDSHGDCLIQ